MDTLRELVKKINIEGSVRYRESLALHTTYRVGGPADLYVEPRSAEEARSLSLAARSLELPRFVLGGGANILVSDRGIRGLVLATGGLSDVVVEGDRVTAGAGAGMSAVSERAAQAGLAGLDFIYSMPGSVGGALWMNARCYGSSISEVLEWADILDENDQVARIPARAEDFAYKVSPFQRRNVVILRAGFRLRRDDPARIRARMEEHRADRERKGHFCGPSAGSVFKNNPAFGSPSGKIIDSLGLRGERIGGAKVSDLHANIIVNAGGATAEDIDRLTRHIARRVKAELGFELEREVIPVGEW